MKALYSIYKPLKDRVEAILQRKQQNFSVFNSDYDYTLSPFYWLHKFIFVIEKYLKANVPIKKYEIIYSSIYSTNHLHEKSLKNLKRLEQLLRKGEKSVNNPSFGFVPPSSKDYYIDGNYHVDFSNQFYGIKHFHLCQEKGKRNVLLFYVIDETKIYFLSIGIHDDLYSQKNIEIIVREFPDIAIKLGIAKLHDMPVNEPFEYSVAQLKRHWTKGLNSSFIIDGEFYTSIHLQTTSKLNTEILNLSNNVIYQYRHALENFIATLGAEHNIVSLKYEDNSLVKEGVILVGDEISKIAVEVKISYFERLEMLDKLIGFENNKVQKA